MKRILFRWSTYRLFQNHEIGLSRTVLFVGDAYGWLGLRRWKYGHQQWSARGHGLESGGKRNMNGLQWYMSTLAWMTHEVGLKHVDDKPLIRTVKGMQSYQKIYTREVLAFGLPVYLLRPIPYQQNYWQWEHFPPRMSLDIAAMLPTRHQGQSPKIWGQLRNFANLQLWNKCIPVWQRLQRNRQLKM